MTNKSCHSSSDRRQWQRIFKTLIKMLQSQQSQLQTLADDRKFLEKYILIQHDHWSSKTHVLASHISQLKKEEAKGRKIYAAELGIVVDMKEREALRYKMQCDLVESDLEDFHACVEALSIELSELKEKLKTRESGQIRSGVDGLQPEEGELGKLKHSCKNLNSEKETEVSGLLAERDFVGNQLKKTESDYTAILEGKKIEIKYANETMGKLQHDLQELQTTIKEKNEMITELKARHELEIRRQTQELQQASEKIKQLELDKEGLRLLIKEKNETISTSSGHCDMCMLEMDAGNCTVETSRLSKEESAKQADVVHELVQCSSKQGAGSDSPAQKPKLLHTNSKINSTKPTAHKSTGGKAPRRKNIKATRKSTRAR